MARKQTATKTEPAIVACCDHQSRTCIQVKRTGTRVKYIPFDARKGLRVLTATANEFDQRYEPIVNYPAEKACQLFLNYSQTIGATKEALGYLGQIVNVSKQEADMATTKKTAAAEKAAAAAAAAKPAVKKAAPVKPTATEAAPAKAAAKPAAKPAAKTSEKKISAAQMFQDLIMAGKLTDDQIFEKVQAEFGLDEKKRGYVKWYRNHLKKQGKNPPEAKVK